jgi:hypothetical protein
MNMHQGNSMELYECINAQAADLLRPSNQKIHAACRDVDSVASAGNSTCNEEQ